MATGSRESFEQYVRPNRVFILGAGFSADAGIPLTNKLLIDSMRKFQNECPGIYSRVENYSKESIGSLDQELDLTQVKLADLCTFLEYIELREYGGGERWCENGSREKLALRFYLAKTIVESTPTDTAIPELYLDFAQQLHPGDVVISFNWDTLLEVALTAMGKTYTYNFSNNDAIKLFKLHGSVNWRLGEPNCYGKAVNTLGWQSLEFTKGMMLREIFYSLALNQPDIWSSYHPLGELDPFLVLPGYGKAFDVRANAPLWYKPEWAFATTHDVYIIGLSLAPDDFFIRSFFLSNLPCIQSFTEVSGRRIFIVNPDPQSASNYEFILSTGHADLIQAPFSSDHVEFIRSRLNQ